MLHAGSLVGYARAPINEEANEKRNAESHKVPFSYDDEVIKLIAGRRIEL